MTLEAQRLDYLRKKLVPVGLSANERWVAVLASTDFECPTIQR